MKILLAHNSLYYPAHGGGDRSNRLLMEALAARQHYVRVIARTADYGPAAQSALVRDLAARGVPVLSSGSGVVLIRWNGVEVHTVANHPNLRSYFAEQLAGFDPDVIIASTDDPAQVLLEAALRSERPRIVYLARATLPLPFGPDCAFPSASKTAALRQVDAIVGVSRYVSDYVQRNSGIPSVHVPISLLEPGPYPVCGRFENEFITMVNPSATKGISVFLALAQALPHLKFAAVPTWGTNAADLAALRETPNVTILDPVDDIKDILRRTRVMLIPSLWAEARSRMVIESLVHGVPVLASDVGGLGEAMMSVPYLLPVNPITRYQSRVDENMVPVAEIPPQDIAPWKEALEKLEDRAHWEEIAAQSRAAGLDYAKVLTAEPFEQLLEQTLRVPPRRAATAAKTPLSPEKQKLLALRLKKKAVGSRSGCLPILPNKQDSSIRLFCFPFAGGGGAFFRGWGLALGAGLSVAPIVLPGREGRLNETPIDCFDRLVELIREALDPYLDAAPFAFFGHSMGAALAFEVARALRREGRPLPLALLVSGARAPQYRRGHVPPPEPSDEELLAQLRSLQPPGSVILSDASLLRLVLPALRADTKAYRGYIYQEDAPLPVPIFAYGGKEDPQVTCTHLEAWREQTTEKFAKRLFPGGHFYLRANALQFLPAMNEDLNALQKRAAATIP